jgi:septal ring factor EnvC (AmiA/AmiB activator)
MNRLLAAALPLTVVIAWVLLSPVSAAEPATDSAKLDEIKKKVDESIAKLSQIDERLKTLETTLNNKVASIEERMRTLEGSSATAAQHDLMYRELRALRAEIDAIRKELGRAPTSVKVTEGSTSLSAQYGTLSIDNQTEREVEVVVNGSTFVAPAQQVYRIFVPAGVFKYRVVGFHNADVQKNLTANDTFNVRVHR